MYFAKLSAALLTLAMGSLPIINCNGVHAEFLLFANQNPANGIPINSTSYGDFVYDPTEKYIILCHGWKSLSNVTWYDATISAFMTMPHYVVIGAYYQAAVNSTFYLPAVMNVPTLGRIVGDLIINLHKIQNIPLEQIEIVGHSLGAHIAGHAGNHVFETLQDRVHRIFGLDPAAPGFTAFEPRLKIGDAAVVIGFHTSLLGLHYPVGNLNFYPNGGAIQGACGWDHDGDHAVATYYFYCSVNAECNNIGTLCNSYDDLSTSSTRPHAQMGYWVPDSAPAGSYYLTVTCPPPW